MLEKIPPSLKTLKTPRPRPSATRSLCRARQAADSSSYFSSSVTPIPSKRDRTETAAYKHKVLQPISSKPPAFTYTEYQAGMHFSSSTSTLQHHLWAAVRGAVLFLWGEDYYMWTKAVLLLLLLVSSPAS